MRLSCVLLCLSLLLSCWLAFHSLREISPLSQKQHRTARRRLKSSLRWSKSQGSAPPGEPCDEKLFVGEYACCWIWKRPRNYDSLYRYVCDSEFEQNTDCEKASEPSGGSLTAIYKDSYACSREVITTVKYTLEMFLGSDNSAIFEQHVGNASQFSPAIVAGVAHGLLITEPAVELQDRPTLHFEGSPPTGILNVTLKFVEDDAVHEQYDTEMQAASIMLDTQADANATGSDMNATVSRLPQTLLNIDNAFMGESDRFMKTDSFKANLTSAIQQLGGDYEAVVVDTLVVHRHETSVLGSAMLAGAPSRRGLCTPLMFVLTVVAHLHAE